MKNLIGCFILITFSALLMQCKSDDRFDELETIADDSNNQNNDPISTLGGSTNNEVGSNNVLDDRGLPLNIVNPADNGLTSAKVELGRLLFWDPILSGERDVSCATCHHPQFGYGDGRALPIGVGGIGLGPARIDGVNDDIGLVQRNSPTIVNT